MLENIAVTFFEFKIQNYQFKIKLYVEIFFSKLALELTLKKSMENRRAYPVRLAGAFKNCPKYCYYT